jgi:hypothetical protein
MLSRFSIFILILYMLVVSDVSIQIHWCGDNIHAWSIDSSKDLKCGCDKNSNHTDHCKNIHFIIKIEDIHNPAHNIAAKVFSSVSAIIPDLHYCALSICNHSHKNFDLLSQSHTPPILALSCSLLI